MKTDNLYDGLPECDSPYGYSDSLLRSFFTREKYNEFCEFAAARRDRLFRKGANGEDVYYREKSLKEFMRKD